MEEEHKAELRAKLVPFMKGVRHSLIDSGLEHYCIDQIVLKHISAGGFPIKPMDCVDPDTGNIGGNCPGAHTEEDLADGGVDPDNGNVTGGAGSSGR